MADFYLDTSAIGNEYQAYADTPTSWAVPQDGNGKAGPGHAAAVPVCEVTFAAVPTSGTISVYGVTVTLTGVLNAASTAAAATALASSINATTTAVGSTVCRATLPLNRFVFARVKPGGGANDSIVQIMCRIAGADLNFPSNSSARVTNTFNNSAMTSPVDFTGGADGPFAYLFNADGQVFGKAGGSTGDPAYGIWVARSSGPTDPVFTDPIHVRTRRSGANIELTYNTQGQTRNLYAAGAVGRTLIFDDGTIWSGDDGQFKLTFTTNNSFYVVVLSANWEIALIARKKYGLHIFLDGPANTVYALWGVSGRGYLLKNVWISESIANSLAGFNLHQSRQNAVYDGCKISYRLGPRTMGTDSGGNAVRMTFLDTDFEFGQAVTGGSAANGFFAAIANGVDYDYSFINCRFVDRNGLVDPVLVNPFVNGNNGANMKVSFENCTGVAPFAFVPTFDERIASYQIFYRMPGVDGAWRMQSGGFVTEWRNNANIPYLRGILPSGTQWSVKCFLRDYGWYHTVYQPLTFSVHNRGSAAAKTVNVELLVPSTTTFNRSQIGLIVGYTTPGGTMVQESSLEAPERRFLGTTTPLPAGIGIGGAGQWNLNGASSLQSVRLSHTTQQAVAANTAVSVKLIYIGRPPGNTDLTFYVDPEPELV